VPDFEVKIVIKNVSRSDINYIFSRLKEAVEICKGKMEVKEDDE
jgi:hypothetical protein